MDDAGERREKLAAGGDDLHHREEFPQDVADIAKDVDNELPVICETVANGREDLRAGFLHEGEGSACIHPINLSPLSEDRITVCIEVFRPAMYQCKARVMDRSSHEVVKMRVQLNGTKLSMNSDAV